MFKKTNKMTKTCHKSTQTEMKLKLYRHTVYRAVQKFGKCFWKKFLMLIKAAFIWSKNTEKNAILWNIIAIKITVFYFNIL